LTVQENGRPVVVKHYPQEFKADAVALYRSRPGATIKSVATDLGVNTETLRNWIRAADGRRPAPTRHPGPHRRFGTRQGDTTSAGWNVRLPLMHR
jgi:transposase